jgi:hypothetical protein
VIFLTCLPFQADIVLREIRGVLNDRNYEASKNKSLNKPVLISTLAAIGIPKLKILATEDTIMFRTLVNVSTIRNQISDSQSRAKLPIKKEETKLETENSDKLSEVDKQEMEDKVAKLHPDLVRDESKDINEQSRVKFIGNEPYFMISQASENLIKNLDDLFNVFDSFQNTFYSGEAQVAMKDQTAGEDDDKAIYEESILVTVLGENYMDFIDPSTGEWINEKEILDHFNKLFHDEVENLLRNTKNQ